MSEEAREHLENVHGQLNEAAGAGDESAGELADHVGAYLSEDEPSEEAHEDLVQRLGEGVRRFEVSHPSLSATVQTVVDSLTASGI